MPVDRWLIVLRQRLRSAIFGRALDRELDDELRYHIEQAIRAGLAEGLTPEVAERRARLALGGLQQRKEECRDMRGWSFLRELSLSISLKATGRFLRKHVRYLALSTAVLAVSTGANLLVFTIVNALWLRPFPIPEPERVVAIPGLSSSGLNHPAYHVFEEGVAGQVVAHPMFEGRSLPQLDLAGVGLGTLAVTPGYFDVLRVPVRGRGFTNEDMQDQAEPVAVISDRLLSRLQQDGSDPLGALLPTGPLAVRVVGVAPPEFRGAFRGEDVDIWIPSRLPQRIAPSSAASILLPFGRMGPDQTIEGLISRFETLAPDLLRLFRTTLIPLPEIFAGGAQAPTLLTNERRSLGLAAGLALLVLVGGCATIAAIVLMHYEGRRAELALKMAIGAGRRRLVVQAICELVCVAAFGTAAGLAVVLLGVRLVPTFSLPGGVDIGQLDLSIDWRVAALGAVVTFLTLGAAAALPILRSTRPRLAGELVTGAGQVSLGSLRVRQGLLMFQVAAATVVLVVAGIFVRSVGHAFGAGPGFDVDRTVFVSVRESLAQSSYGDLGRILAVQEERTARLMPILRAVPGVNDVADGPSPIGPDAIPPSQGTVIADDREHQLIVGRMPGGPELLSVLGIPLVAGRHLVASDANQRPTPVVITRSLAETIYPNGEALGAEFRITEWRGNPYVIVGIANDFAFRSLALPTNGVVVTAGPGGDTYVGRFVVRTDRPQLIARALHETIRGAVVKIDTGVEVVARDIGRERLGAWVFSGFGLAAFVLGLGGVFGLVAYLADSRRRDFGVRLALGADLRDLVRHATLAALIPVCVGCAVGVITGAIVTSLFIALLTGVSPLDVFTYVGVIVTMVTAAAAAGLVAVWRLRSTSPADALRSH